MTIKVTCKNKQDFLKKLNRILKIVSRLHCLARNVSAIFATFILICDGFLFGLRGIFWLFEVKKPGLLLYLREQSYSDKLALAGWLRTAGAARSRA